MKLSTTTRASLTLIATALAGVVATIPSETVRAVTGGVLVVLAAVGIVPSHVKDPR